MSAKQILIIFLFLRAVQFGIERYLSFINRRYYTDSSVQKEAGEILAIEQMDMKKTLSYSTDKYFFGLWSGVAKFLIFCFFIYFGGLGWVETIAKSFVSSGSSILTGVCFFMILGLLGFILNIPFGYYSTFVLEEKHGFNKQTKSVFITDLIKGLALSFVLGGILLFLVLFIMEKSGSFWWLYAAIAVTLYSLVAQWAYPVFLAPLFNKFRPLDEGELKEGVDTLSKKVGFNCSGVSIMNASMRSSHGNAYFTGMFGKKKIVLFDTLIESLNTKQIVAVLAHELGHFKLNHVRNMVIRGTVMTFVTFYLLSLFLPIEIFYNAFALDGVSIYGALVVFFMWFGFVDFVMQPLESFLSRKNEFAADAFALNNIDDKNNLAHALLKMRENSHAMPISHPLFSAIYYSHPPMIERLKAMGIKAVKPA